jgi:hypothetical protein
MASDRIQDQSLIASNHLHFPLCYPTGTTIPRLAVSTLTTALHESYSIGKLFKGIYSFPTAQVGGFGNVSRQSVRVIRGRCEQAPTPPPSGHVRELLYVRLLTTPL